MKSLAVATVSFSELGRGGMMARLRHPGLVQVFDYGMLDNGASYFTMELLAGADLSTFRDLSLPSVASGARAGALRRLRPLRRTRPRVLAENRDNNGHRGYCK